jgi:O-antigen ligase
MSATAALDVVQSGQSRAVPFALATVVLGLAFFLTQHDLSISRLEMFGTVQEQLEANAVGGKWTNQAGFLLVGLLGVLLIAWRDARPWHVRGLLPLAIVFFAAWCLASTLWSVDPARTFKRGGILLLCMLGALGVGRALSARDLCRLALVLTTAYALLGLGAELALGTFKPFGGGEEYRFAGTLHPNGQGANCALLCLSAICLLTERPRGWGILVALIVLGFVLLLLTRSRASLAALLVALVAIRFLRPSRALVAGAFGLLLLVCGLMLASVLAGSDPGSLVNVLLLGRMEHAGTLTGRTELWEELLPFAQQRLLLGHGYGSFWDPQRIEAVSETVYWSLSSAHSVYLEAVLGIGVVGAGALAVVVLAGLWRAARTCRAVGGAGYALVFALLVIGLVGGIAESDFLMPSFETLVAGCGLAQLGFFEGGVRSSGN